MNARTAAAAVLILRIAYGLALLLAPGRITKRWLGPSVQTAPTQVPLQALGAREVILHAGGLFALRSGAPLRPWLAASATGDVSDIVATTARRGGLPQHAAPATAAVAGGSALLSLAVAATLDR
jgi:hypothetical protein